MMEQGVLAERVMSRETERSHRDESRVRKLEHQPIWNCRIKLNKERDTPFVGSSKQLLSLHTLKVTLLSYEKCSITASEQEVKTRGKLSQHQERLLRGQGRYVPEDKTYVLETKGEQRGIASLLTWPSGRKEMTTHLKQGELHTFSDGSSVTFLEVSPRNVFKLGVALNVRPGTYTLPADQRFSPRRSGSERRTSEIRTTIKEDSSTEKLLHS
jgi:hypothetical protein